MKKLVITIVTVCAFTAATLPSQAQESLPSVFQYKTHFVNARTPLTSGEMVAYEQKTETQQKMISHESGGAEAGTGTIVLAVIGALVVIGAVVYAVQKNKSSSN